MLVAAVTAGATLSEAVRPDRSWIAIIGGAAGTLAFLYLGWVWATENERE